MCGIFFTVRYTERDINLNALGGNANLTHRLYLANAARGPDAQGSCSSTLAFKNESVSSSEASLSYGHPSGLVLNFFASELRLRGDAPVVQPHKKEGDVLCWNGEIFEGMDVSSAPFGQLPKPPTVHLLFKIPFGENDGVRLLDSIHELQSLDLLPDLFGSLEGPYAFVFYHSSTQRLYFGRDPLGRRSLLMHKPTSDKPYFILASVSAGSDPGYQLDELSTEAIYCLDFGSMNDTIDAINAFDSCLSPLPRHRDHLPYAGFTPVNPFLPHQDTPQLQSLDDIPDFLLQPVDDLIAQLDRSVMLRVQSIPQVPEGEGRARVAILFSGGIDSTIIAFLAHKHVHPDEPIDLLNVAFENPRKIQHKAEGNEGLPNKPKRQRKLGRDKERNTEADYLVPDRITGLDEVEELRRLCPSRIWNFVAVDVPFEESQTARPTVEALMWPGRTVMDLSLALALYFASRGKGHVQRKCDADPEPYTSPARVLLNGLGSDELLGGYGRHRTVFNQGAWQAVINELQLELDRLPMRNLGRDDRVISSHGKETRHPFLSLSVVSFITRLPVQFKVDPRLELGFGDKMLLRLATRKLGLVEASERKKKAMQFGSHSARMELRGGDKRGDLLL